MKVIYLTGAPAAGKSTASAMLAETLPEILLFEYGAELTNLVRTKGATAISQDDLREWSSLFVTPEDVQALVDHLLEVVDVNRSSKNIIIDSHPVIKEGYGFRATTFSKDQICELRPSEIWVLYADPEVTVERIRAVPAGGRPEVTLEQARMHTAMQSSVALTYGVLVGAPVYFFDLNRPQGIWSRNSQKG